MTGRGFFYGRCPGNAETDTMLRYPHIASRIFNSPLLIHPAKLDAIVVGLAQRLGLPADLPGLPAPGAYTTVGGDKRDSGYRVVNGVAVLDVFGVLVHRSRMEADSTFLLGYQDIARRFEGALADPEVRAILLNLDSPGGEVAGAFDLADQVYRARGRKPIEAVAGDLAASAAYALASAADRISVTRTGLVGSVGVVLRHVDMSRLLDAEGVTVTHIFAGARKVDGNPYQPLPADVRTRFQGEIDRLYGLFVDSVARNRGLSAQQVRDTEADVFMGEAAVQAGLADRVETPDEALARLASATRSATQSRTARAPQRTSAMSDPQTPDTEHPQPPATATVTAPDPAALATAAAEGRTQERARIGAILRHPEAQGREGQALALALDTDLAPEAAGRVLAASAKGGGSRLAEAMAKVPAPAVGAEPPEEGAQQARQATVAGIGAGMTAAMRRR